MAPGLAGDIQDAAAELGGFDIVVATVSALAIRQDEASWKTGFDTD